MGGKMKSAAIFDMDGLMFDTERIYRDNWMLYAPRFGYKTDPEFPRAVCGTSGQHMLDVIESYYPGIDAMGFKLAVRSAVEAAIEKSVPLMPGIRGILQMFSEKGVPCAVASSSRAAKIEHCLLKSGLAEFFAVSVSGEAVEHGKPAPDIFLCAAEKLGFPPESCYVFEDGLNGVHAGIAAGCTTIMIPDLLEPDTLAREKCAGIYPNLDKARNAILGGEV
jgi:HAD superfamily hydrolase (TIGR01509 family)